MIEVEAGAHYWMAKPIMIRIEKITARTVCNVQSPSARVMREYSKYRREGMIP